MVTVDGQPLDLLSYVNALPETLTDELWKKASLPVCTMTAFRSAGSIEQITDTYASDTACRNAFAVLEAVFDKMTDLNAGTISNIGVIDFCFSDDSLNQVIYSVYKADQFKPD